MRSMHAYYACVACMRTMHAYYACVACMRICHVCIQAAPSDFVNFANMLTQYTRDEINNLDWHAFWENVRSGRGVLSLRTELTELTELRAARTARAKAILGEWLRDHWQALLEAHYIDDSCALVICHYYACALCMRIMHAYYACVACMRTMHACI